VCPLARALGRSDAGLSREMLMAQPSERGVPVLFVNRYGEIH
jgi:hypothetical protein